MFAAPHFAMHWFGTSHAPAVVAGVAPAIAVVDGGAGSAEAVNVVLATAPPRVVDDDESTRDVVALRVVGVPALPGGDGVEDDVIIVTPATRNGAGVLQSATVHAASPRHDWRASIFICSHGGNASCGRQDAYEPWQLQAADALFGCSLSAI
jgi:hypothetical protein